MPTIYNSTDTGAPTLNGVAGSLIGVLDACLVNGYGSAGVGTGRKDGAGWIKAGSGTNLALYRQGAGNQLYLNLDDTQALYAQASGFETATAVNTGTNQFPAPQTTFPNGVIWGKCASAVATQWTIFATSKAFHLWINYGPTFAAPYINSVMYFYGDLVSYKPNDAYATMIIGSSTTAPASSNQYMNTVNSCASSIPAHYICRPFHQMGTSVQVGKHSDSVRMNAGTVMGRSGMGFPNPIDGTLVLAPVWVHEPGNTMYPVRGILPGLWVPCHTAPGNHGDTFSGGPIGSINGKTFVLMNAYFNNSTASQCAIETSNGW